MEEVEVVDSSGQKIDKIDENELHQRLLELIYDDDRLNKMKTAGKQLVVHDVGERIINLLSLKRK